MICEQLHEGVSERGAEAAGVEFAREGVDCSGDTSGGAAKGCVEKLTGKRVLPEVVNLEYCFWVWKVQPCKVGLYKRSVRYRQTLAQCSRRDSRRDLQRP